MTDVLIQAALRQEFEPVLQAMKSAVQMSVGPWTFWVGRIGSSSVVLSRTDEGPINAAAATALGIHVFKPQVVLNQGIAGAYNPELRKGDIVIGRNAVDESGFARVKPHKIRTGPDQVNSFSRFAGDTLVEMALSITWSHGRLLAGTLGSAMQYNLEIARILWLRETYGTDTADQESAFAAGAAFAMRVPFLGMRVISDSVFSDPQLDKSYGRLSAEFVLALAERAAASTSLMTRSVFPP